MSLFKLRGKLSRQQSIVLGLIGLFLFILVWWLLAEAFSDQRPIVDIDPVLPSSLDENSNKLNEISE